MNTYCYFIYDLVEGRRCDLVNVAATMYLRSISSIFMALVQFSSLFVEHLEKTREEKMSPLILNVCEPVSPYWCEVAANELPQAISHNCMQWWSLLLLDSP